MSKVKVTITVKGRLDHMVPKIERLLLYFTRHQRGLGTKSISDELSKGPIDLKTIL
jgi:hypothetical protein